MLFAYIGSVHLQMEGVHLWGGVHCGRCPLMGGVHHGRCLLMWGVHLWEISTSGRCPLWEVSIYGRCPLMGGIHYGRCLLMEDVSYGRCPLWEVSTYGRCFVQLFVWEIRGTGVQLIVCVLRCLCGGRVLTLVLIWRAWSKCRVRNLD